MLGWELDWSGLPVIMAIVGLTDIEMTVRLMRYAQQQERALARKA